MQSFVINSFKKIHLKSEGLNVKLLCMILQYLKTNNIPKLVSAKNVSDIKTYQTNRLHLM